MSNALSYTIDYPEDALFVYGAYKVDLIEEEQRKQDKDGVTLNYSVTNIGLGTVEAELASLPQAMSVAVSFDKTVDHILKTAGLLDDEDDKEEEEALPQAAILQ